jgi:osmotically-inducible protein OsmY
MTDYDEGDRGWWDKTSDEVASWFGDEEAARRRRMDARSRGDYGDYSGYGGYRGRGPSGYSRSDDRIKEDINDRLTDYDYIDATNVTVDVHNGEVTLSGTVDSRYEKRIAEDIAEDISGVQNVENRLRVNSNRKTFGTGSSTFTSDTQTATGSTSTSTGTQARGKSSGT